MRRRIGTTAAMTLAMMLVAAPALACGGLVGPKGTVNLLKTTTLAAYHDGIEHYVTSFTYAGAGGGKFGSIVPLPGVPTDVKKGGEWTLQRLLREVAPPLRAPEGAVFALSADAAKAEVLFETKVDSLDITVLRGGGSEVATWAIDNGFELSPDAPEMLDFYGARSPIFMAVRFNTDRAEAQGITSGQGTPVHVTIPTDDPWVPLRILALGREPGELVEADVFLLTDRVPAMLPGPRNTSAAVNATGLELARSEQAGELLMDDLRSDKGMGWMPDDMWLSYVTVSTAARDLRHDLAIDVTGGEPSWIDAGLAGLRASAEQAVTDATPAWVLSTILALALALMMLRRRSVPQA